MQDPSHGDTAPPDGPGSLQDLWRVLAETGIPQMSVRERRAFPRAIAWHLDQERREAELKLRAQRSDLFWVKLSALVGAVTLGAGALEKLLLTWHW